MVAIPLAVPIIREEGYRTDTIGRCADGLFLANVIAGFREDFQFGDDWAEHKRWYAYLHRFDRDGRHLGSEVRFAGTTAQGEEQVLDRADRDLADLLDGLTDRQDCDIAIQLFRIVVDGVVFGLVDESDDERGEHVELYPDNLGFAPPWDGEYDT